MKKLLLLSTVMALGIITFAQGQYKFEVQIKKTATIDGVDVSSDDAEQVNDEIDKLYDDDLDAGWEGDDFNIVSVGLRFTDVNIPQGATIDSAFIEVYSHEEEADATTITIWGEASDNPVTFDTVNLITDRPSTTATVEWDVTENWAIWTQYRTPYITTIIQEIVNRPGWDYGNALAIIMEGEDLGASATDQARDMESFENEEDPDDGGDGLNHPERIPKLVIYFQSATGIEEASASNNVEFFPNPADESVRINVSTENTGAQLNVEIFDLRGQRISESYVNNGQSIDIQDLKAGMYLVRINTGEQVMTKRLIVE